MQGPFKCSGMSFYEYSGQMDEHKIPQGNGKIVFQSKNKNSTSHLCYDVLSKIQSIQGNFENGTLNGKAVIGYKNLASMQVRCTSFVQFNDYSSHRTQKKCLEVSHLQNIF